MQLKKIQKYAVLPLIIMLALTACRDDDEKVNRTKKGGGAVVESNPEVVSASFAECGVQITDIEVNPLGKVELPAGSLDANGVFVESEEASPVIEATVSFVLINEGGNVQVSGTLNGAGPAISAANSVGVSVDGGSTKLTFVLDSIPRDKAGEFAYENVSVVANYTRPDNEQFGPCEGSRGVDLQIIVPEPVMLEAEMM